MTRKRVKSYRNCLGVMLTPMYLYLYDESNIRERENFVQRRQEDSGNQSRFLDSRGGVLIVLPPCHLSSYYFSLVINFFPIG